MPARAACRHAYGCSAVDVYRVKRAALMPLKNRSRGFYGAIRALKIGRASAILIYIKRNSWLLPLVYGNFTCIEFRGVGDFGILSRQEAISIVCI